MFGPRLQAYVCVDGPDGMCQFGPDDEVPDWALPLITNPEAWEDGLLPDLGDEDEGEGDPDGDGNPDETGGGESVPGDDGAPAPKRPRTRAPKNADDVAGDAS